MISEQGVKNNEQFPHAGGYDDFEGFSLILEALGEGFDGGVEALGGQGGHIEQAADVGAAAGDMGPAILFSRFSVIGGQADQGGDLMAIEPTQFGQARQQHSAGLGADAAGAAQDLVFVLEVRVGLDVLFDEFIQFANLEFKGLDHFANAFADFDMMNHPSPIGFLSVQVDELTTSGNQFSQGLGLGVWRRFRGGLDLFAELGQGIGVDGIGFGQAAHAAGEVADLARMGDDDVITGLHQFGGEGFFVAAGGFQNDQSDFKGVQGPQEVLIPRTGVGVAALNLGGVRGDLKRIFGDVDAEINFWRHGILPFLPMRANRRQASASQAAVRVRSTGATRTMLYDGLEDLDAIGLTSPLAAAAARCAALFWVLRSARLAGSQFTFTCRTIYHA